MNIYRSIINTIRLRTVLFNYNYKHLRYCHQINGSNVSNNISQNDTIDDKLYKKIVVEVRGAEPAVLKSYHTFVSLTAQELGIIHSRSWDPFRFIQRRTLLRAAFVKKKYRVQYEYRNYFKAMEFKHLTGSTADTFIEYIQRNLPEGVAMKVYKTAIEALPDHIVAPKLT